MKVKSKKVICSILLVIMIISNFYSVFATTVGETEKIISKGECPTNVWYGDIWIETYYVGFNENGKFRPAYCIDIGIPGVDDDKTYNVEIEDMSKIPNHEQMWRVLLNGFPYKTPKEMGLKDEYDAYFATKQAIYRTIDGKSTDPYHAKEEEGEKVVAKIKELVNIGKNGTQTYKDPVISISKKNDVGTDSKDSKYISQSFVVTSQVEMSSIKIVLNKNSAPEGTFIADANNNAKTSFNKGETLKVLVPRDKITEDIEIQLSVDGKCKTYPILFGKAPSTDLQDYLITTDPYVTSTARFTMKYNPSAEIEIQKVSKEDSELTGNKKGEGIEGAIFIIESEDGQYKREVTTDKNGKILLSGLELKQYSITEKVAPNYYLKGENNTIKVELKYDGDNKKVVVENTPVEIKVDIDKKTDKEEAQGNEIVTYSIDDIKNLSNVKLDKFILTDNLPEEVRIKSLETGTYNEELNYSITYNTNKNTNILLQDNFSTNVNNRIDFTNIELEDDEYITSYSLHFGTVKIGFSNTSVMKVETEVVEGIVDKSQFINNVKISGTYLEKTVEDEDDVPVTVYENVLKVIKIAKESNQYTELESGEKIDATFEILNENKEYIDTVSTLNGQFEYKYLETGKQYYLKEISVDEYYVIQEELIPFVFEKNGQVLEIIVENENVNLVVDVEKEGPTEAEKNEIITYDFNNIGNYSNTFVNEFTWGDKLPRQVTLQTLETGTWNEEMEYKVQYITNRNTNWKNIGEFKTTENNTIDFTKIKLDDNEYIKEFRIVFGTVKSGFTQVGAPKVSVKVNEDVQNNKIFVNNTYVNASYQETKLIEEDEVHTVVYTKEEIKDKELPKTGFDY